MNKPELDLLVSIGEQLLIYFKNQQKDLDKQEQEKQKLTDSIY